MGFCETGQLYVPHKTVTTDHLSCLDGITMLVNQRLIFVFHLIRSRGAGRQRTVHFDINSKKIHISFVTLRSDPNQVI